MLLFWIRHIRNWLLRCAGLELEMLFSITNSISHSRDYGAFSKAALRYSCREVNSNRKDLNKMTCKSQCSSSFNSTTEAFVNSNKFSNKATCCHSCGPEPKPYGFKPDLLEGRRQILFIFWGKSVSSVTFSLLLGKICTFHVTICQDDWVLSGPPYRDFLEKLPLKTTIFQLSGQFWLISNIFANAFRYVMISALDFHIMEGWAIDLVQVCNLLLQVCSEISSLKKKETFNSLISLKYSEVITFFNVEIFDIFQFNMTVWCVFPRLRRSVRCPEADDLHLTVYSDRSLSQGRRGLTPTLLPHSFWRKKVQIKVRKSIHTYVPFSL